MKEDVRLVDVRLVEFIYPVFTRIQEDVPLVEFI